MLVCHLLAASCYLPPTHSPSASFLITWMADSSSGQGGFQRVGALWAGLGSTGRVLLGVSIMCAQI